MVESEGYSRDGQRVRLILRWPDSEASSRDGQSVMLVPRDVHKSDASSRDGQKWVF